MEERYGKYRKLVNNIIPLQIGITCFEFIWDDDSYKVTTFTFPLFKKPILSLDRSFLLQAAAVVFLTENNFDFNKVSTLYLFDKKSIFQIYFHRRAFMMEFHT